MQGISELDMVIRLALSFLAGAVIGFERSHRRRDCGPTFSSPWAPPS
jgi:uncharacterized membrane protein YhiD involved in acid resistance